MTCPICNEPLFEVFSKNPAYKICKQCKLYFQDPLPEKIYEGPQENFGQGPSTGYLMSDIDKSKNSALAEALYSMFRPNTVLDIGSKYPYFLSVLTDRCEVLGIDGIKDIIQYGQDLKVPVLNNDVEIMDMIDMKGKYDLITLIHVLEHFYCPFNTIQKILSCLSNHGVLYIRTPDPEVSGIERNLTDNHLKIHPYLFTRKSMDKLMEMFGFKVFRQDKCEGYGQSDFYIHKNRDNEKTISLCMIVKNEEKNIEDCLESVKAYVDEIIIVDTGSTDKTKDVVAKYTDKIYDFPWIDDFSAARNFSLSKATKSWILYCDADDIFQNPQEIQEILKSTDSAFNTNIIYGNEIFCHARLFRNFSGVYFKGRVHEYPVIHNLSFKKSSSLNIIHKTQKTIMENRILRNIRILTKELEEDPNNVRAMFYMANALRESGKYNESIEIYHKYLSKSTWQEERFQAQKYIGQIYQSQKQHVKAIEEFLKAVAIDERWAEAYYYIGENYFLLGKFDVCIRWMLMAASTPIPDSTLFKEIGIYRDLPYRYLFACYDTLGNYEKAIEYCKFAVEKNPNDDWLKQRLEYFEQKKPIDSKKLKKRTVIECYRQGALGDCLMTTAALRGLKGFYPGCFIRYITHPLSMQILDGNQFIDELTTEGKPDTDKKIFFCYPDKDSLLKDEGYPNKPLTRHLTEIFWDCAELPKSDYVPHLLECTLTEEEEQFGKSLVEKYNKYITLHTRSGWSPYKEWYNDRWGVLVSEFSRRGYTTLQIMKSTEEPLILPAISLIGPIKKIISAIKYSSLHIGIDSFSNHAAQAVGKRSVILFGSTSPTGSGYKDSINIWKGLECSPCYREYAWLNNSKGPCPYNKKCMDKITVEEVMDKLFPSNS